MPNYSPDGVIVAVLGVPITGFATGTFIKCSRDTDSSKDEVGATGDVLRIKSLDRRGTMEITLMQSSSSNDRLSALMIADEEAGPGSTGVGTSGVKGLEGTTFVHGDETWIMKPADVGYADAGENRVWKIRFARMEIFAGGSVA